MRDRGEAKEKGGGERRYPKNKEEESGLQTFGRKKSQIANSEN